MGGDARWLRGSSDINPVSTTPRCQLIVLFRGTNKVFFLPASKIYEKSGSSHRQRLLGGAWLREEKAELLGSAGAALLGAAVRGHRPSVGAGKMCAHTWDFFFLILHSKSFSILYPWIKGLRKIGGIIITHNVSGALPVFLRFPRSSQLYLPVVNRRIYFLSSSSSSTHIFWGTGVSIFVVGA